jgi:hypothetical protein
MKQKADDLPALIENAGEIRHNQPVFGSVAPILANKKSILRIAGRRRFAFAAVL